MRKLAVAALLLLGTLLALAFSGARLADRYFNVVLAPPLPAPSARARELYRRLRVVDLHGDSLLWGRDLLARGTHGHIDVPRLIEGNVALQAFTIVTKTPLFPNYERNDDQSDMITVLALFSGWPMRTWRSLSERALYQAARFHDHAFRSRDRLVAIETAIGLEKYLKRRVREPEITAGFLGIEGAHALDQNLDNIDVLFDAGVRMMAPTHFFDNDLGGSAHGVEKGGLTEKGREMIRRMEEKRMLLDLAHASPRTIDDAVAMVSRAVIVSHTGVRGTCDNARNLSDDHVRAIARTGGVIGIGYWKAAVCGTDAKAIARAMRYTADLVGVEHVALGSDFDGTIAAPFDTTGLAAIVDALFGEGFNEDQIAAIMGENAIRVLLQNLP